MATKGRIARYKRAMSLVLALMILLGTVIPQVVQATPEGGEEESPAATANSMAGKMINFFGGTEIEDISTISPEELRVYAIFMSNFFKPGETTLGSINLADGGARKAAEAALFPGGTGEIDNEQFTKLNNLMFKSIEDGIVGDDNYRLLEPGGGGLTGLRLKEMMSEAMGDKVENKHLIHYGEGVHLDLADDAVRSAFKILLGYNIEFMLDKDGLESYNYMYVDGYGNIWGHPEEVMADELILVMPAAINPATFSGGKHKKADRLPINNSFGIGGILGINQVTSKFQNGTTAYYNLSEDVKQPLGGENVLQIWGLTSPFDMVGDSGRIATGGYDSAKALVDYYSGAFTEVHQNKTKLMINIVASDRVGGRMESALKGSGVASGKKGPLLYYLGGTVALPIHKVQDTLFYSTSFSPEDIDEMESTISELGVSGQSMFTQEDGSQTYSDMIKNNDLTDKLSDFISGLGTSSRFGKSDSGKATVSAYRNMGKELSEALGKKSEGKEVEIVNPTDTGKALVKELSTGIGSNRVTKGEAAVLFLSGNIHGAVYAGTKGNKVPSLLAGDMTTNGVVEAARGSAIASMRSEAFSPIRKGWVNGLTERDAHLWLGLYHKGSNVDYDGAKTDKKFDVPSLVGGFDDGMVVPSGKFHERANSNIFILSHVFRVFGPHKLVEGGRPVGTKLQISGKEWTQDSRVADTNTYWPGVFLAYMDEVLDLQSVATGGGATSFNSAYLPSVPRVVSGRFDGMGVGGMNEEGASDFDPDNIEQMQKELLEKIYGIVSDQPNPYRDRWLKSTIDGFLITLHKTLTGSWFGDMQTVSAGAGGTYSSIAGYIHTPTLEDLPFTEWITSNYMNIYMLFLMIIISLLTIMVLTRVRTLYQGVAIFCIMAVALMLPSILITNTVNISNKASDRIYSDRFDFWALTQHERSLSSLDTYTGTSSTEAMIANTMDQVESLTTGDAGVRLKWMSPKKSDVFNGLYSHVDMSESYAANIQIFKWLFNSFIYDSEFVRDDPLSTYLYRPYNSLAKEADSYYKIGTEGIRDEMDIEERLDVTGVQPKTNKEVSTSVNTYAEWSKLYKRAKEEAKALEGASDRKERLFKAGVLDKEIFTKDNYTGIYYGEHKLEDIETVSKHRYDDSTVDSIALWGVGNSDVTDTIFSEPVRVTEDSEEESGVSSELSSELDIGSLSFEEANLSAYLRNTESPYYYFYATLKHRYGEGGMGTGGFKQALIDKDVFRIYNEELVGYDEGERGLQSTSRSVDGAIRDFLDLEGLFTYTIPYLTASNDYVHEWIKLNGTKISSYDFDRDMETMSEEDLRIYTNQKKHKEDMGRVWNMYSPWVDQMNALRSHIAKVKVGRNTVMVYNTLNPGAYLEKGRPMLFSEADMVAKGYTEGELSDVEIRMQRVLSSTYKDLMYLVNYYDLKDDVLVNAAAMYATFNFNREFSQTNLVGESTMIYPQSFEMKNFNYDAYMQLIMLNATGERIQDGEDLYTTILQKSSTVAGILLIVSDVIGIIIIPTLKIVILLSLLFLGLVLCLVMAINPPEKIFEAVSNSLLVPAVMFMLSNIAFALVISFFVGEGLTSYVGTKGISVSVNDPTVTLLLVGAVGAVYSVTLWKIFMRLLKSCKEYGVATVLAGAGVVGGAVVGVSHKISEVTGKTIGGGTTAGAARAARDKTGGKGIAGEPDYDPYLQEPLNRKAGEGIGGADGEGASQVASDIRHKASIGAMGAGSYAAYRAGGKLGNSINRAKGVFNGRKEGKEGIDTSRVETNPGRQGGNSTVMGYEKEEGLNYERETGYEESLGARGTGRVYTRRKGEVGKDEKVVSESMEREGEEVLRRFSKRDKVEDTPHTRQEVREGVGGVRGNRETGYGERSQGRETRETRETRESRESREEAMRETSRRESTSYYRGVGQSQRESGREKKSEKMMGDHRPMDEERLNKAAEEQMSGLKGKSGK